MPFDAEDHSFSIEEALDRPDANEWRDHREAFVNAWDKCLESWKQEMQSLENEDAENLKLSKAQKMSDEQMAEALKANDAQRLKNAKLLDQYRKVVDSFFEQLRESTTSKKIPENIRIDYAHVEDSHWFALNAFDMKTREERRRDDAESGRAGSSGVGSSAMDDESGATTTEESE